MTNIIRVDAWREAAFGDITTDYTPLGIPFGHAMRLLQFMNGTDGDLALSFDGFTNNIPLLAGSFSLYDLTSDQDTGESIRYLKGTQVYIKYLTAPTKGSAYIVSFYGLGE